MLNWWRGLSKRQRVRFWRGVSYVVFVFLVVAFLVAVDWSRVIDTMFRPDIVADQFPDILLIAAKNTIWYTILGFAGGLILGLVLALMRLSQSAPFRWASAVYIDVVRGIPLLVWILLIGLGLPIALRIRVPTTYGPGALALSLVMAAYMAETIRAGIEAVDRGQMEAARSLGMTHSKAMIWIVLPQATTAAQNAVVRSVVANATTTPRIPPTQGPRKGTMLRTPPTRPISSQNGRSMIQYPRLSITPTMIATRSWPSWRSASPAPSWSRW